MFLLLLKVNFVLHKERKWNCIGLYLVNIIFTMDYEDYIMALHII